MLLLVGLGNPGTKHQNHRHNLGFMTLDRLVERYSFGPWRRRFQGQVADGRLGGRRAMALKPGTFMNLSGQSVGAAARYFHVSGKDIVVFHDEIDLAPGKIRVKQGGGTAGHNGLRSIDSHMGPDFRRVRVGVGHPGNKAQVQRYLLRDFPKRDKVWLDPLLDAVVEAAEYLAKDDDPGFSTKVALLRQPPKPSKPAPTSTTTPD
ncbi:MAG TPA: aminoacyl-tRNA hydrolase [Alphaproteobacteria bacterium]|jgi:PTH1 family peptidyl-tRNA hydrolase|nr:aminoacyl-tRNA hydrolase [Alphaproteobacteria bacterium]